MIRLVAILSLSCLYLIFLGFIFWYKKLRTSNPLDPIQVVTDRPEKIFPNPNPRPGSITPLTLLSSVSSNIKSVLGSPVMITIDPSLFTSSMIIEKDDNGGILIRCASNQVVEFESSGNIFEDDEIPFKSKEEVDNEFLQQVNELSESMKTL